MLSWQNHCQQIYLWLNYWQKYFHVCHFATKCMSEQIQSILFDKNIIISLLPCYFLLQIMITFTHKKIILAFSIPYLVWGLNHGLNLCPFQEYQPSSFNHGFNSVPLSHITTQYKQYYRYFLTCERYMNTCMNS